MEAVLKQAKAAGSALTQTLQRLVNELGPAAVAPCWDHQRWNSRTRARPKPRRSSASLGQLRRLKDTVQREVDHASLLQDELDKFLKASSEPLVIVLEDDCPQPQPNELSVHQTEECTDRLSQLRALCYAASRVFPVLEDACDWADLAQLENNAAAWSNDTKFTCAVCMNDEQDVQDGFYIQRCGHRMCRGCALMTIDFNIKQGKPQCCVECSGTLCPRCPITLWKRHKDLTERAETRQASRVAACEPLDQQEVQSEPQAGPSRPREAPQGAGAEAAGQQGQGQEHERADDGPAVKYCCMSQADLLLLLQPEELQQRQIQRRERYKRRRAAAAAPAADGGEAGPSRGRGVKQAQTVAARGAGVVRPQTRAQSHVQPKAGVPVVDLMGSQSDSNDYTGGAAGAGAGPSAGKRKRGKAAGTGGAAARPAVVLDLAGDSQGGGADDSGSESSGEEWGWDNDYPPPTYEAYLKADALRLAHLDHMFKLCPKCGEGVELADGTTRLVCPSCRTDQCVACGVAWHEGSSCEKYQQWARENAMADEAFQKLKDSGEVRQCPKCGTGITRIDGCHHMTCTACRCKFCFRCGAVKQGQYLATHGCDCMNGAAWEHDPRARIPAQRGARPGMPLPPPGMPPPRADAPLFVGPFPGADFILNHMHLPPPAPPPMGRLLPLPMPWGGRRPPNHHDEEDEDEEDDEEADFAIMMAMLARNAPLHFPVHPPPAPQRAAAPAARNMGRPIAAARALRAAAAPPPAPAPLPPPARGPPPALRARNQNPLQAAIAAVGEGLQAKRPRR